MIYTSQEFNRLANATTRDIYTKIVATVNSQTYTITGSNSIVEMSVEEKTANDNIQLGATCSSELKVKLRNVTFTLPNATFQPYISFDNTEWCPLGKFFVTDIEEKDGVYEITAYDKIAFLTGTYEPTIGTTFSQMITQMGLTLASGQTVPSYAITTSYKATQRDYLSWIASYMGRNARINRYGELEFVWYKNNGTIYGDVNNDGIVNGADVTYINTNLLGTYSDISDSGILSGMTVGNGHIGGTWNALSIQADVNEDGIVNSTDVAEIQAYINGTPYPSTKVGTILAEESYEEETIKLDGFSKTTNSAQTINALVSGYGETSYTVGSGRNITFTNPYITQSQLQSIWNDIITSNGFSWQPCSVKVFGNPSYEVGDLIAVKQGNTTYSVPIMSQTISINGGLEIDVHSYGYSNETLLVTSETFEESVDRKTTTIQAHVEEIMNNVLGAERGILEVHTNANGVSDEVRFWKDSARQQGWLYNANGFGFTNNGGTSLTNIMADYTGNFYANKIVGGSVLTESFKIGLNSSNYAMSFDGTTGKITFGQGVTMSWADITDKPTIPDSTSDLVNDSGFIDSPTATVITQNTVTTSYVNALNVTANSVNANWVYANNITASQIAVKNGGQDLITYSGSTILSIQPLNTILGNIYGSQINCYYNGVSIYASSTQALSLSTSSVETPLNFQTQGNLFVSGHIEGTLGQSGYGQRVYLNPVAVSSANFTDAGYSSSTYGLGYNSSSIRYKTQIEDVTDETLNPNHLYDLEVKQFKYKEEFNDDRLQIGFIAEDVAEKYPFACYYKDGVPEAWTGKNLIPAIVKLLQDQHKEIIELKKAVGK